MPALTKHAFLTGADFLNKKELRSNAEHNDGSGRHAAAATAAAAITAERD